MAALVAQQQGAKVFAIAVALTLAALSLYNARIALLCAAILIVLGALSIIFRNAQTFPVKAIALVSVVAVNHLNLSNNLILYGGLPSINKTLIPLLACYVLYVWYTRRKIGRGVYAAITVAAMFYVVISASVFDAKFPEVVLEGIRLVQKDLLMMIVLVALIETRDDLELAAATLVGSATLLSVVGIYSYFIGAPGEDLFGFSRWKYHLDGNGISDIRISGPIGDPNFFAQILLIALPLGIYFIGSSNRFFQRGAALISCILIAVCILMTQSRGGVLVLAALVLLSLSGAVKFQIARAYVAAIVVIAFFAVVVLAPDSYLERIRDGVDSTVSAFSGGHIEDEAVRGRVHEMIVAAQMVKENPLFGIGYNSYSSQDQTYSLNQSLSVRGEDREAHNLLLELAAEIGLVGLLVFLVFVTLFTVKCFKVAQYAHAVGDRRTYGLAIAILQGFIAYMLAGIFLHDAFQRYMWLYFALVIAAAQIEHISTRRASPRLLS